MASRERAIVFGNCQASALEYMLTASTGFAKRFRVTTFPPVHEITPEKVVKLHASLGECRLLVVQRVSESYRGLGVGTTTLASMAPKATIVRWPDAYWGAYFPDLFYTVMRPASQW
jgi:Polysaccharide biosynthesis enzyme WcbI